MATIVVLTSHRLRNAVALLGNSGPLVREDTMMSWIFFAFGLLLVVSAVLDLA